MPKIIISGCNGKMGQTVAAICGSKPDFKIVAGFDQNAVKLNDYPVYSEPLEFSGQADVIVDFSSPDFLDRLLSYALRFKIPCVLCTTGYSKEQLTLIETTSKLIPIFKSGNMSVGVNLLTSLVKKAAAVLGEDFDVEIVESHHNQKVDAPSGTALMLADAAAAGLPHESEYVYDRHSLRQKRKKNEIGISSIRGGSIVGEHEVIFAGMDEVVVFKHTAYSRSIFANGAVTAAEYMSKAKEPRLYDMNDVLLEVLSK